MNAVCTTYTLIFVLYRWPDNGQLAKTWCRGGKMKTHNVVLTETRNCLFSFSLMEVVYLYDKYVSMKAVQDIFLILAILKI